MARRIEGDRVADRYRIVRCIGAGGMGAVYEAVDGALGRAVAIKLLERDDPNAEARMLREAKVVARIAHPNVVSLFDAGREGDDPFLVMELLGGTDLARVIAARGRLPVEDAVRWILEAAAGVGATGPSGAFADATSTVGATPASLSWRVFGGGANAFVGDGALTAAMVPPGAASIIASSVGNAGRRASAFMRMPA